MKKILLAMLFVCSLVVFTGCNHHDTNTVTRQRSNSVPVEQQQFYNNNMPDGNEQVEVTETETVEEIPAQ